MRITAHARKRLQQRGFRTGDIETLCAHGTRRGEWVFLSRSDAAKHVRTLKGQIADLERLRGTAVCIVEDQVITAFRPAKRKRRHVLRR